MARKPKYRIEIKYSRDGAWTPSGEAVNVVDADDLARACMIEATHARVVNIKTEAQQFLYVKAEVSELYPDDPFDFLV